jgi:hypothetical protein
MENEVEVMQVIRVPPSGKLVVQINGQRYDKLSEITSSTLKQRLITAIGELIVFVDGYDVLVDAGVAPPPVASSSESSQPSSIKARRAAFEASQTQNLSNNLSSRESIVAPTEPIIAGTSTAEPADQSLELDIVGQIDILLQKYVAADPSLAGRSIHLAQDPNGGLQIRVDNQVYSDPGEVNENSIRLAIKGALEEWNSS